MRAGSVYTTTQSLEDKRQRELWYNGGGGGGGGGGGSSAPVIGSGAIVASRAEYGCQGGEAAGRVVAGCAASGCAGAAPAFDEIGRDWTRLDAPALDEIGRDWARLDAPALDEIGRDWARLDAAALDASDAAEAGRAAGSTLVACGGGGVGGACGSGSACGAGAMKELHMGMGGDLTLDQSRPISSNLMGGDLTLDPHLAPSSPQTPEAAAAIEASRELIRAAMEVCEAL